VIKSWNFNSYNHIFLLLACLCFFIVVVVLFVCSITACGSGLMISHTDGVTILQMTVPQ